VLGKDLQDILLSKGLLTKATHKHSIRLAPALNIKSGEIGKAARLIKESVKELEKLSLEREKK